jgi:tRNA pseudouridine55 synthase
VGHTGTLDPAAVGVLPIALGRATRTVSSTVWDRKLYWADVRFGAATDTDDADGRTLETASTERLTAEQVVRALQQFVGDLQQRPPAYSAVHVGGQRAYRVARRRGPGTSEEIALPARSVRVDAITLLRWEQPVASVLIQCGSGTYIRSIARDLGAALGCPAHLGALVRLRVGPFGIQDALDLAALETVAERAAWTTVLWPADVAASDAPAIVAYDSRTLDFDYGRIWRTGTEAGSEGENTIVRVYTGDGRFLGLARPAGPQQWQPVLGIPGGTALPPTSAAAT